MNISKAQQRDVFLKIFIENNKEAYENSIIRRMEIFDKIYRALFTKEEIELMVSAPKWFFSESYYIYFRDASGRSNSFGLTSVYSEIHRTIHSNMNINLDLEDYGVKSTDVKKYKFPFSYSDRFIEIDVMEEIGEINSFLSEMKAELSKTRNAVLTGFSQFNTLKKCQDGWPEILPYLSLSPKKNEVMVLINEINNDLKIPKSGEIE